MTVASQVNYITMMLPIKIPSTVFKQFDDIIKPILCSGIRPRIKLSRLCAHKEKGGLDPPDPRLYHLYF